MVDLSNASRCPNHGPDMACAQCVELTPGGDSSASYARARQEGRTDWQSSAFNEIAPERDAVNHPEHYTQGGIECIEAIRAALTPEEFRGFCKGNMLKYVWRERHKGGDESVRKAQWYGSQLAA